nr:transposase domain-containing protein [Halomonas chromatireducens]
MTTPSTQGEIRRHAYLRDVLERLPTQKASQIHELLPHHWQHTA